MRARRSYRWPQRLDSDKYCVFARTWRGHRRGDPVPENIGIRSLRSLWLRRRIRIVSLPEGAQKPVPGRWQMIIDAVKSLDTSDLSLWTSDAKPRINVIEKLLGFDVTGAERDQAIKEVRNGAV